jgi:hypothetical protein
MWDETEVWRTGEAAWARGMEKGDMSREKGARSSVSKATRMISGMAEGDIAAGGKLARTS